eukprot:2147437-Rhodomonas_salina.2
MPVREASNDRVIAGCRAVDVNKAMADASIESSPTGEAVGPFSAATSLCWLKLFDPDLCLRRLSNEKNNGTTTCLKRGGRPCTKLLFLEIKTRYEGPAEIQR